MSRRRRSSILEPPPPENESEMLGRYRLCFELAAGGMATVYLARVAGPGGFDKLVALKRIHPHLANEEEFVEMFLDEARIAARLNHPNVCNVFDFGEADGTYFITMEYLFGETVARLSRTIANEPAVFTNARVPAYIAKIVADACEGLHAAHELKADDGTPLGLVHRDISPQNLSIAYDGSVKVMDFGIAHAAGRLHRTETGQIKGKYAYMAPERLHDKPMDRRSDIWSLGVVLWEMLTGRRLFRCATEPETILAVTTGEFPTPSRFRRDISSELDRIVMKALERDPDKRFQTARDLGRDLAKFNSSQSEPALMADLAEWMDVLFRDDKQKREQVVELARQAGAGPVPKIPASLATDGEDSDAALASDAPPRPHGLMRPRLPPWLSDPRAQWALLGGGLGLVVIIVALITLSQSGTTEAPDEPSSVAAPAPATTSHPDPIIAPPPTPPEPPEPAPPEPLPIPTPLPTKVVKHVGVPAGYPIRPQPAVNTGTGTVTVSTPGGWADIVLNGRHIGRTPDSLTLPAGTHTLTLIPFGRDPARTQTVTVRPGAASRVVVRLGQ